MGDRFGWGSEAPTLWWGGSLQYLFHPLGLVAPPAARGALLVTEVWILPRNRNAPAVLDEALKDSSSLVGDPKTNEV